MDVEEEEVRRRQRIRLRPSEYRDLLLKGKAFGDDIEIFITEEDRLFVLDEVMNNADT